MTAPTPDALRFVARGGRLVQWRPAVLVGALAARAGAFDAYVAWPSADAPLQVVPAGDRRVSAWVRETFERWASHPVDDATWNALRARSLLALPASPGVAAAAAERGLGRPLRSPSFGCVSATGHPRSKLLCFAFEHGRAEPTIVVKGVVGRGRGGRLLAEADAIEAIRAQVTDLTVARGLPPAPSWAGVLGEEEVVVEPVDELAAATGVEDRDVALEWLLSFQRATGRGDAPWAGEDEFASLCEWVSAAWRWGRPATCDAVVAALGRLLEPLQGAPVPRCSVHGDFWRGNVATGGGAIRVYDWEWATTEGRPFFDLWTYELGALRQEQSASVEGVAVAVAAARRRVEAQLERRGLDARFAHATLAPVVAELAFRVRRVLGEPPAREQDALRLLAAVERLVLP